MIAKLKNQFEEACNIFIRPPRHEYDLEELGRNPMNIKNQTVHREDIILKNEEGKTLQCSFFQIQEKKNNLLRPCIIYLHCNAGSRCEVLPYLSYLISIGVNAFSFDMSGCGKSEGEYITLGYKEILDVKAAVEYIRTNKKASVIGLWGRSMGAVTALKYASTDKDLAVLIIDSPFSNLNKLTNELAKDKTGIPGFILPIVLGIVKKSIKKKVEIKFNSLDITKFVHEIRIPTTYIFSYHDEIIKPYHVEKLFELHGCSDKKMLCVKGRHNDPRPINILKEVARFISEQFSKKDQAYKELITLLETPEIQLKFTQKNELLICDNKEIDLDSNRTQSQVKENQEKKVKDWDLPQISEELPRLFSNVSLLSQNSAKFLLNKENSNDSRLSSKQSTERKYNNPSFNESHQKPSILNYAKFSQSADLLGGASNDIMQIPAHNTAGKKNGENSFFHFGDGRI